MKNNNTCTLVTVILERKVPDGLRPNFFGAHLIALEPDKGFRYIAFGNALWRGLAK